MDTFDELEEEVVNTNPEAVAEQPRASTPLDYEFPLGRFSRFGVPSYQANVISDGEHVERLLQAAGFTGSEYTQEFAEEIRQFQVAQGFVGTGEVAGTTWGAIVRVGL